MAAAMSGPKKNISRNMNETGCKESDRPGTILAVLAAFIRSSPVPQFLIDGHHCVLAWNRALEECTGIKEEEILGTNQHWNAFYRLKRPCLADLVLDDMYEDLHTWYKKTSCRSSHPQGMFEVIDFFPQMGPNGKWIRFTAVPVQDGSGNVIGTSESLEDVTEQRRRESALKLATKKLNVVNCIASHEIQNKITGVRGYVELSRELTKNTRVASYIDTEESILKQVHELLQYAKEYEKIGTAPPRWVNIRDAVRSAASLTGCSNVQLDLQQGSLEIFCDPAFERMLSFLIESTIKNTRSAPAIRIGFYEDTEGLHLTYVDNSQGIPQKKKKDIFTEHLVKAENFHLRFVHDLLEFSGMSIKETGEPGRGARFEITAPRGAFRFTPNRTNEPIT